MSIHRSYFNKNNTIISYSYANTGRNPVVDLYFGLSKDTLSSSGYTRYIFNINLEPLFNKILDDTITVDCVNTMTHHLIMTNTIKFDEDLLNTYNSDERRRASSFDLILFRIPKTCYPQPVTTTTTNNVTTTTTSQFVTTTTTNIFTTTTTTIPYTTTTTTNPFTTTTTTNPYTTTTTTDSCVPQPQNWDEGVGYDSNNYKQVINNPLGVSINSQPLIDNNYSKRPSNWYETTNFDYWTEPGMYSNTNTSKYVNYSDLYIVDVQHFDKGNEDIDFDMTAEINGILNGTITDVTGWGIAFRAEFETITGLTSNYSVSFFSRHTQTFYEPYLLTTYDDLIEDNRNLFVEKTTNKLYLFAYVDGNLVPLDEPPTVTILDPNGIPISGLTNIPSCQRTRGVYEATIPTIQGYVAPCIFNDLWSNIKYGGGALPDIENEFTLMPYRNRMQIGTLSRDPELFGFDFYGIKQDEKVLNTDIRKVGVIIKKAFTSKQVLQNVEAYYRVFVREGLTEVQVQDWTKINRTMNEYYFVFDTRDKIPNEYFIDIKVNTSGETEVYKKTLKFMIVNKK